jgi:glycosyltransferase involved in cell wall biosynthesis
LLRAFARLRAHCDHPIRLTLVGTGDAEDTLHRLATDLGVADAVTFTGFVPRGDMPAVYRQADIFVLPSQNEGMSIALLEAMASGLPVVVTDTGGTAELVEDGVNGLIFEWGDVDTLATHLRRLATHRSFARRMGTVSRVRAAGFSWDTVAERYQEIFVELADEKDSVWHRRTL